MTQLYLLSKKTSNNSWQINKIKKGVTKDKAKKVFSRTRKQGLNLKVLSERELAEFLLKNKPKEAKK